MSKTYLRQLYAELPTISCRGECWPFCSEIDRATSSEEWGRMTAARGGVPEQDQPDLCWFLKDGRCTVYQVRPLICRLWGVTESMRCPYGCKPSPDYLSSLEGYAFIHRLINGGTQAEALAFLEGVRDQAIARGDKPLEWGAFEGSAELTVASWSRAEREAMLKLKREGRTADIAPSAKQALDLLDDSLHVKVNLADRVQDPQIKRYLRQFQRKV